MNNLEAMHASVCAIRGKILQHVIETEILLDIYIGEYFTNDVNKQEELIYLLISPTGMQSKKSIFEYLLLLDKTKTKEEFKNLLTGIDRIKDERNLFAHWPVDFSKDAEDVFKNERKIYFQKLKQGKFKGDLQIGLERPFSEEDCNSLIKYIESINNLIKELIQERHGVPALAVVCNQ